MVQVIKIFVDIAIILKIFKLLQGLEGHAMERNQNRKYGVRYKTICKRHQNGRQRSSIVGYIYRTRNWGQKYDHVAPCSGWVTEYFNPRQESFPTERVLIIHASRRKGFEPVYILMNILVNDWCLLIKYSSIVKHQNSVSENLIARIYKILPQDQFDNTNLTLND